MFNPTSDFPAVVDGLQAAVLVRRGQATKDGQALTHVLRHHVADREVAAARRAADYEAAGAAVTAGDTLFSLPGGELDSPPALGDAIVDAAARRFTILEVRTLRLGSVWQCVARDLAWSLGLDQPIEILAARYTKGAGGASVAAWDVWRSGVAARVEDLPSVAQADAAAEFTPRRVRIDLAEELRLDQRHRVRLADGRECQVTATRPAERLGEPWIIEALLLEAASS